MAGKTILAGGGVVWRRAHGPTEVAVVHRPRYDDWTLPKGKQDPGESLLETAVREIAEEIGSRVAVSRRISTVRYDYGGARKKVTYWVMRHRSGEFVPNDEVDELRWLPVNAARQLMSYGADRDVLSSFASLPVPDSVVVLVRHAKAGKRSEWHADDVLRPLDPNGERQAHRLVALLSAFAPKHVYSADRVRCTQTVQPLASALGLDLQVDADFNDESFEESPLRSQTALLSLGKPGEVSVVCSQGLTIPSLVDRLGPGVRSSDTRKGAWWVLSFVDGDVVSADHYDAP